MKMVILRKHQLSIVKNSFRIFLVILADLGFSPELPHDSKGLFDFFPELFLIWPTGSVFVDGFDNADVVFIEVKGKNGVRGGEVVTSCAKGPVFSYNLHVLYMKSKRGF